MNKTAVELLEFNKIKEILCDYAVSDLGKKLINNLEPAFDINTIEHWLKETTEAKKIVGRSSVPLHTLQGIEKIFDKFGKGAALFPEELNSLWGFIRDGRRLKKFLNDRKDLAPLVCSYGESIDELEEIYTEIQKCIRNGRVDDGASSALSKIRKKIGVIDGRIKSKLDKILKSSHYQRFTQESLVSIRNGRYVIPVKNEYRSNIKGSVVDTSSSGATVFIEPQDISKLQDEMNILKIEEEKEIERILLYLTGIVEGYEKEIRINIETMAYYDFIFAKGKYSRAIDGNSVEINNRNYIKIIKGRHPLLGKNAVPLDFEIGEDYRALLITGPNTGGKTVSLKTVGLLTMMVQCGIHVPVEMGSEFSVFLDILVDIGDGQSIEQSLSTFSSHIRNIISIMQCAEEHTLVIIDELGTGTDPGEGMGLAVSILEDVFKKGSTILATTHYSEIKKYAEEKEGFKNGCMEFDIETLKPLYKLSIGKSGDSNAFLIALRLGMDKSIIERAHEVTYKEIKSYENYKSKDSEAEVSNEEIIEHYDSQIQKKENIDKLKKVSEKQKKAPSFNIGDCVYINTIGRTGIVCEIENNKGEVGVTFMNKKIKVNKKRLSLYIDSSELYPEDYDMDIVLESKENRKKKHIMDRKHCEGVAIVK